MGSFFSVAIAFQCANLLVLGIMTIYKHVYYFQCFILLASVPTLIPSPAPLIEPSFVTTIAPTSFCPNSPAAVIVTGASIPNKY